MRPLYKTQFTVRPADGRTPAAVADEVLESVQRWIASHYERNGEPMPEPVEVTEITRHREQPYQLKADAISDDCFHRGIYWTHPASDGAEYHWTTLCDPACAGGSLDFQLVLGVEADDYHSIPSDIKAGRPRVIPDLLTNPHWSCVSGGTHLPTRPKLVTVHEVEEVSEASLFSEDRRLPVVVVSPGNGRPRRYPVKPEVLADRLGGVAQVLQLRDDLAASVLDQYLGPNLAVGPDAVRVFAPDADPADDPSRHWTFLGETIRRKRLGHAAFADILFARLAERVVVTVSDPPALVEYRARSREERRLRLQRLEERFSSRATEAEELYFEAQERADEQKRQLELLEEELRKKDDRIRGLEFDLEVARGNIAALSRTHGEGVVELAEAPATGAKATTVAEIARDVAKSAKTLVFLDSALDSASKVPETYKFPDRVRAHLEALEAAAEDRDETGSPGIGWKEYFQMQGSFKYKGKISGKTRNKWGDEYTFDYQGEKVLFEEHFTIGKRSANTCLSIHFSTRLHPDKIVVAWVGRHLTNTQT